MSRSNGKPKPDQVAKLKSQLKVATDALKEIKGRSRRGGRKRGVKAKRRRGVVVAAAAWLQEIPASDRAELALAELQGRGASERLRKKILEAFEQRRQCYREDLEEDAIYGAFQESKEAVRDGELKRRKKRGAIRLSREFVVSTIISRVCCFSPRMLKFIEGAPPQIHALYKTPTGRKRGRARGRIGSGDMMVWFEWLMNEASEEQIVQVLTYQLSVYLPEYNPGFKVMKKAVEILGIGPDEEEIEGRAEKEVPLPKWLTA